MATAQLSPMRFFSPEDLYALLLAGIVAPEEWPDVLVGKRRFTVEEYLAMVKVGILRKEERIELIDGEIIVLAPIGDYHVGGVSWLHRLLVWALGDLAMVQSQCPVYLNDGSAPQPDIAVVRLRPIAETIRSLPPDVYLIVEFADSSLAYDSGPKLALYAAAGIPEVWVANLRAREVMAFTNPATSGYTTVRTYRAGENINLGAFPDISLEVDGFMPPAPGPDVEVA